MEKRHVILDTDISNEVDDQFALAYLVKSLQGASLDAITIAPFEKTQCANIKSIKDGINLSHKTACKILDMLDAPKLKAKVFKGAEQHFCETKIINPATQKMIEICRANKFTTILAIGAITNVALALHFAPDIAEKTQIVWLGGNSFLSQKNDDFNFRQDVDAVRKVFNSKAQVVVVPCSNVAAQLATTTFELQHYLGGLGQAGEYLCQIFERSQKIFAKTAKGRIGQSKNLWDVGVVAYFVNKSWFKVQEVSCPKILDDTSYKLTKNRHKIAFVSDLNRDKIFQDFFIKMGYKR